MIQVRQIDTDSINYLIQELEQFEKNSAIKKGLQAGGNLIQKEGKRRLKERIEDHTGNLRRSFKVRVKRNKAGVLIGFIRGKNGGNHAHLVDRGTKKRKHPITGTSGVMPANYFWTDTENIDRPKAVNEIFAGVEKAVKQINNKR